MKIYILLLFVVFSASTQAQNFSEKKILQHIKTLADDRLEGRGTGTPGEQKAAAYITQEFKKAHLVPKGNDGNYLQPFPFKSGVHGEGASGTANNVLGFLDNQAQYTIVIGAHYDHLGNDGQSSSLDANPQNKIHNGADDNASGVAGVIELAKYFSTNKKKENYNFLFICFSGEELGLLGSKYAADHLPAEIKSVNFMINMDMIGRLDPQTKTLIVNGTGTSPVWEPQLKKFETETLKIKTDSSGTGPSDHTSFYLKDIPVLHFFTGAHADYHKPSDDYERINAAGEAQVLTFIARLVDSLDGEPKLTFTKTKSKATAGRSVFKVTLGIMPSYANESGGLKVDGVSDGKPAAKAGVQTGDYIIQIGEHHIDNIQQYMDALGKFEKGQTVPLKVKRANDIIELSVTF